MQLCAERSGGSSRFLASVPYRALGHSGTGASGTGASGAQHNGRSTIAQHFASGQWGKGGWRLRRSRRAISRRGGQNLLQTLLGHSTRKDRRASRQSLERQRGRISQYAGPPVHHSTGGANCRWKMTRVWGSHGECPSIVRGYGREAAGECRWRRGDGWFRGTVCSAGCGAGAVVCGCCRDCSDASVHSQRWCAARGVKGTCSLRVDDHGPRACVR